MSCCHCRKWSVQSSNVDIFAMLFSFELRNPLLLIGCQAFCRISACECLGQQLTFERETFGLASLNAGLNRPLNQPDRLARLVGSDKLARVIQNLIKEI